MLHLLYATELIAKVLVGQQKMPKILLDVVGNSKIKINGCMSNKENVYPIHSHLKNDFEPNTDELVLINACSGNHSKFSLLVMKDESKYYLE